MNNGKYTAFHDSELTESIALNMEDPESIWHQKSADLGWKTILVCSITSITSGIILMYYAGTLRSS